MAGRLKRSRTRARISPFEEFGRMAIRISIDLPMKLCQEPLPGDDSVAAALYGPLVLAANLGPGPADGPMRVIHGRDTVPKDLPVASAMPKVAGAQDTETKHWIQVASAPDLNFTCSRDNQKYDLIPMYEIQVNVTQSIGKPGIPNNGPSL